MMITQHEKKKPKFRISFIFLFIIASFAVCFTFYMREDFEITEEMLDDSSEAVVYIEPAGHETALINPVPKSDKQGEDYYDDAVFIGGKALAGLADYGYVKSDNMLVSDSIRLEGFNTLILAENDEQSGIAETVRRKNPGKIYIMVGLYELDKLDSETLFDGLEAFIDDINADGGRKIYLMSLLPVPASTDGVIAANTDIDAFNSLLLKFANKAHVSYLDINTEFKGNDGKLPASAAELNGIRLTEEYYKKLSDYILTHTA